jgi:hypothetical protein
MQPYVPESASDLRQQVHVLVPVNERRSVPEQLRKISSLGSQSHLPAHRDRSRNNACRIVAASGGKRPRSPA